MRHAVFAAGLVGLLTFAPWCIQAQPRAQPAQPAPTKGNIPYTDPADKRQVLDVYAPRGAKNLPVVFWIHGGGWQGGDKSEVYGKPQRK